MPGVNGEVWLSLEGSGLWRSVNSGTNLTEARSPAGARINAKAMSFGKQASGSVPWLYIRGTIDGVEAFYCSTQSGHLERMQSPVCRLRNVHTCALQSGRGQPQSETLRVNGRFGWRVSVLDWIGGSGGTVARPVNCVLVRVVASLRDQLRGPAALGEELLGRGTVGLTPFPPDPHQGRVPQ